MPNLQQLQYYGDGDGLLADRQLGILSSLPKLQSLTLSLRSVHEWADSTLVTLQDLTALTSLDLSVSDWEGPLLISIALGQADPTGAAQIGLPGPQWLPC